MMNVDWTWVAYGVKMGLKYTSTVLVAWLTYIN